MFAPIFLLLVALARAADEPSPPRDPVAKVASKERFLLYDVIFHEQVNKQRRALMYYLDLAMKLRRTLVLPRTRLLRRKPGPGIQFEDKAEYAYFGALFNFSHLSSVHHVIELEQYLALHYTVSMHVQLSHQCQSADAREEVKVPFNGLEMHAHKSICTSGLQYDMPALKGTYKDEQAIAFGGSVDQLMPQIALPIRPYVRFEQSIYDQAAAFVQEAFNGEPYLAIHWRRTDFLMVRRTQEFALQSPTDLIAHARFWMRRHNIKHVYLATDSDDASELAQVEKALHPKRYKASGKTVAQGVTHDYKHTPAEQLQLTPLLSKTVTANIDIALCGMADRFLGTRTSSFTLAIMEERVAVFGHHPDTGIEMGKPPDVSKDEL